MNDSSPEKTTIEPEASSKGKDKMKRYFFIGILVVLAGIIYLQYYIITQKNMKISTLQEEKAAGQTEQLKMKTSLTEISDVIEEVANKLQDVRQKEVAITNLVTQSEVDKSKKSQIINDISLIESQLQQDKRDIEDLNNRIKHSGIKIKSLENMVTHLKKEIQRNEQTITELRATIEQKDKVIKTTQRTLKASEENLKLVKNELQQTHQELEETRNVLEETKNRAWYIIGKKKELKAKNIVEESGIFFQKKSVNIAKDFDVNAFTKINITQFNDLALDCGAKDVKMIPFRSDTSYRLEEQDKNKSVLIITNPEKFWQIPYLVIIVKG